jgi:hypothetical protein
MGRKLRSKATTASHSLATPPIKTLQQGTKQTQSIPLSLAGILPSVFDWTFARAHLRRQAAAAESYIQNGARNLADVNSVDLPAVASGALLEAGLQTKSPTSSESRGVPPQPPRQKESPITLKVGRDGSLGASRRIIRGPSWYGNSGTHGRVAGGYWKNWLLLKIPWKCRSRRRSNASAECQGADAYAAHNPDGILR